MSEEETQSVEEKVSEASETTQHDFKEPITKKDPKRVEQGKRLALISKQAKEKKMRERIEMEMFEEQERRRKKSWLPTLNPYTVGGLSLFLIVYAYQFGIPFRKKEEEITKTKMKKEIFEDSPKTPEKKLEKKFEAFD